MEDKLTVDDEEVMRRISSINLQVVKTKLMDSVEKEDEGWDEEKAEQGLKEYRRFLLLKYLWPGYASDSVVPSPAVAKVWRYHILDTRNYFADMPIVFGHYLHHDPLYGTQLDYEETRKRYWRVFGQHADTAFWPENLATK